MCTEKNEPCVIVDMFYEALENLLTAMPGRSMLLECLEEHIESARDSIVRQIARVDN